MGELPLSSAIQPPDHALPLCFRRSASTGVAQAPPLALRAPGKARAALAIPHAPLPGAFGASRATHSHQLLEVEPQKPTLYNRAPMELIDRLALRRARVPLSAGSSRQAWRFQMPSPSRSLSSPRRSSHCPLSCRMTTKMHPNMQSESHRQHPRRKSPPSWLRVPTLST